MATKKQNWKTASGLDVPANRVTAFEKKKEKVVNSLVSEAEKLSKELKAFKLKILKASKEILDFKASEEKAEIPETIGNFTFSNFHKDKKIEVTKSERVVFNDEDLILAKDLLDKYLNSQISTNALFVKDIILDAFSTSRGRVDTRKVMGLLQYKQRIDHPDFQKACELIEKAQDRPGSKTYARISVKNAEGEYEYIDLNFSSL